jgi:uncharacterized damage-inducible protein DinB
MTDTTPAIFESWNRHNTIVTNLVKNMPESGLGAKATNGGWTVAEQLAHMHGARVGWLEKVTPEFASDPPWLYIEENEKVIAQKIPSLIVAALDWSAKALADAVKSKLETEKGLDGVYSHPVYFLEHMLWHEAYHAGQMMVALKITGQPFEEDQTDSLIWDVWKS